MQSIKEIRKRIKEAIPDGVIVPEHTEKAHFYRVHDQCGHVRVKSTDCSAPLYPSVTGKLQIIKDPSIANFRMNRAVEYLFSNWGKINDDNMMEYFSDAKKAGEVIFKEAGHIGTAIHDVREDIFNEWIRTGKKPKDFQSFIPEVKRDMRATSAIRGLRKFVDETNYTPVWSELLVWSHKLKVAGTLDDLGIMNWKGKKVFVLMDLKTSNQFKDSYFFQVAIYYQMLRELIPDLKIDKAFILKISKTDGSYKIEDLESPSQLASYAKSLIRVDKGIQIIKNRRKDNQKTVVEI